MHKKKSFKVEVWDVSYDPKTKKWGAVAELKTGRVEVEARNISPAEVEKLLLVMNRHGLGPLATIGRRVFGGWRLYGGRDAEWDWLVSEGGTLPDDQKVAWVFSAFRGGLHLGAHKFVRVRFFNRELGPFALARVMSAIGRTERFKYY